MKLNCSPTHLIFHFIVFVQTSATRISENLPLPNQNELFDRYWKFLEIFFTCTFHLSHSQDSWQDLYKSVIALCTLQKLDNAVCINIHTTKDKVINFLNVSMTDTWKGNFIRWEATGYEDISPFFKTIFVPLRFSLICLVQLPTVQNNSLDFFQAEKHQLQNQRWIRPPDFIMVPISPNTLALQIHKLSRSIRRYFVSSRIFLLNSYKFSVQSQCLKCIWTNEFFEMKTVPSAIEHIDWDALFYTRSQQYRIYDQHNSASNICPYEQMLSGFQDLDYDRLKKCVGYIFRYATNCSTTANSCKAFERFLRHEEIQKYAKELYIFPFGVDFKGVRYSVLIKRNKKSLGTSNYGSFLLPFDFKGWIAFTITFVYLGLVLKLTHHQINAYFWMFGTLLEQCDDSRGGINGKNWFLVITWLYAAILIRNVYTSCIYSHMATESGPMNPPAGINEVLQEPKLHFVGKNALDQLHDIRLWFRMYNLLQDDEFLSYDQLILKLLQRFWPLDLNKWNSMKTFDYHECNKHSFIDAAEIAKNSGNNLFVSSETECINTKRFAILYLENGRFRKFDTADNAEKWKLHLYLMDQFYIVESNEQVLAPELIIWSSLIRTILNSYFQKTLGSLVESGVFSYQLSYYENYVTKQGLGLLDKHTENVNMIRKAFNQWVSYGCFKLHKKICSLAELQDHINDTPVQILDIFSVWLLHLLLLITSVAVFTYECFIFQNCFIHRVKGSIGSKGPCNNFPCHSKRFMDKHLCYVLRKHARNFQ